MQCDNHRVNSKHDAESNALKLKMELTINEFNIKRKIEGDK
jgi:hypothetical protein